MCVILYLPKGKLIAFEAFKNAALNNPHGWGIITRDDGKFDVRREYNPKGNDPDEIYGHILDNNDHERFVHVRYNTVGHSSKENAHPFEVLNNNARQINFMHNGTLHQHKPPVGSTLSDTRHYAETFLSPLLYHFQGEHGLGDYTDPFFPRILGPVFDYNNRAVIVANDLPPLFLGTWTTYKDKVSEEMLKVSNTDYFDAVRESRANNTEARRSSSVTYFPSSSTPTVEKREEGSPETPVGGTQKTTTHGNGKSDNAKTEVTKLQDVSFRQQVQGRLFKTSELDGLWEFAAEDDFANIENEDISYLTYLTQLEVEPWVTASPTRASNLLLALFERFHVLYNEYDAVDELRVEAQKKHENATKIIASMRKEITFLTEELAKCKSEEVANG